MENKEILKIIDEKLRKLRSYKDEAHAKMYDIETAVDKIDYWSRISDKYSYMIQGAEIVKNAIIAEAADETESLTAEENTHDYVIRANRLERKFDPTVQDYTWVTVESKTISILANVSATKAMDIYSEYTRAYGETNWQYSLERLDQ